MTLGLPQYLENKISPEPMSGCWLWFGAQTDKGYGSVGIPRTGKLISAHRAVYELMKGPIADGLMVDHLCRNRCCVNPDHLELVTSRTNTLRGTTIAAANAAKLFCMHGHSLEDAYLRDGGRQRQCRTCNRLNQKRKPKKGKS